MGGGVASGHLKQARSVAHPSLIDPLPSIFR